MSTAPTVSLIEIETAHGPIHFRGAVTGRPVVLVILGAFEKEGAFNRLGMLMPEHDVLIAHLPGNHCPWLDDMRLPALTAAFQQAIQAVVGDAPVLLAGVSTGALVALGMKLPNVRRLLLVEPPVRPTRAWPLRAFQDQGPAERFRLVGPLFGVYPDRIEARDYGHLLASLDRPAHVLMGDCPSEQPHDFDGGLPSLVDSVTRADLAAHRFVTCAHVNGVGHNIPGRAAQRVLDALRASAAQL